LVSSAWQGGSHNGGQIGGIRSMAGSFGKTGFSTVLFGTLAGAGGAALAKGNIWAGVATGFAVSFFNHFLHQEKIEVAELENLKNETISTDSENTSSTNDNSNTKNTQSNYPEILRPGLLIFKKLNDTQLADFRVIPENVNVSNEPPKNNKIYETDGFYLKTKSNDKNYWFKIGNGNFATITVNKIGNYIISRSIYNWAGFLSGFGWQGYNKKHWTFNPFIN
jgi:hypothetical protein